MTDGGSPIFATFQSGPSRRSGAKGASAAGVERMPVEVGEVRIATRTAFQEVKQAVDLTKADVIVASERDKEPGESVLAEKLAAALGGELAASRPICDAGGCR